VRRLRDPYHRLVNTTNRQETQLPKYGSVSPDKRKEHAMKPFSILQWYNVLRSHYHFTAFEAIRFALWLAR
jgi:hypothetical protein